MQAFELSKAVGQWKLLHAKEVSYFKTMAQQWNDAVRQNLSEEEKTRFELNAERKVQKVMKSLELAEKARERDRPLFHTNKGFMCHVTVQGALLSHFLKPDCLKGRARSHLYSRFFSFLSSVILFRLRPALLERHVSRSRLRLKLRPFLKPVLKQPQL